MPINPEDYWVKVEADGKMVNLGSSRATLIVALIESLMVLRQQHGIRLPAPIEKAIKALRQSKSTK